MGIVGRGRVVGVGVEVGHDATCLETAGAAVVTAGALAWVEGCGVGAFAFVAEPEAGGGRGGRTFLIVGDGVEIGV